MTKRRKPREAGTSVWVISDRTMYDTYVATVQAGPDVAIPLDRDRAIAYAMTVMTACAIAEYDAAAFRQFGKMGIEGSVAAMGLADLRSRRAPLDDKATAPLRFLPIVGHTDLKAALHVFLDDEPITQWTPAAARGHAQHVLDAAIVVDLDAVYLRFLTEMPSIAVENARVIVDDLRRWRDG